MASIGDTTILGKYLNTDLDLRPDRRIRNKNKLQ